ncbi:hypothetical protein MtrunA17_Chr1g0180771 [Medicago truncatula]|uniref:Uncharacterized protein n=1 Tax=Medicago truncatula TaxID=3880 RepID=I3T1W5_MEDTR|nr:uncharacterized protein LOC25483981 [Medicago truncatula]AFK46507.1 unknown [Medicago truncatula]KEH42204.1 hypothetical protein MTR_1g063360 [Medicago truncatula]RHN79756.1 hypothetical protein MtrunA17_Chr1g0180771 [Medicago truncatula]
MDKYFSSAYRGDPGVPHADPHRFVNIWFGCLAFTASNCINPYYWHIGSSSFNWHDRVMLFEQYHWKKAMRKNQRYEFNWNKTWDRAHRDSYYFNWPIYFT